MHKGLIIRQGIVIGEIERVHDQTAAYRFTYDPGFEECYQLDDMVIRDAPYWLHDLPSIMYSQLSRVSALEIGQIRSQSEVTDEFDLWLACCDHGLIPEEDGCRL